MLLFLRLSIWVQRSLKLEEFKRIEVEEKIMKQAIKRIRKRQQTQKTTELKVKMKAFACRKCSCKFLSNFKLHLHFRAKHTKKLVLSFTDIFSVIFSFTDIISQFIFDIIFNIFFSILSIFFIISSISSSTIIFSSFFSIEISSSSSLTLASTLTISYADVVQISLFASFKLSSESIFNSSLKSLVKLYLIWHDLTVMFRERKSLFQHQKQRVSSSWFRSSLSSFNTHLQSTIAWNIILISAFLTHLIYEDKHSNSFKILSFLRVIAIIF